MSEKRKTFLERLTGTQKLSHEELDEDHEDSFDIHTSPKPWAPEVDADITQEESIDDDNDEVEAGLAIDMYESDNELVIQSMIAGVTPEDLHISISRANVTIEGRRNAPEGIPEEHYLGRELYWGPFAREIELPYEIDTEGAEAVEKYGLLIIRLPRLDTKRSAELKVRSMD